MTRLVLMMALVFMGCSALAKDTCPEGWASGERGLCFSIDRFDAGGGLLTLLGQVRFTRSYKSVIVGGTIYKNRKVVTKCTGFLQDVDRGVELPVSLLCQENVPFDPDYTYKVRIDVAF